MEHEMREPFERLKFFFCSAKTIFIFQQFTSIASSFFGTFSIKSTFNFRNCDSERFAVVAVVVGNAYHSSGNAVLLNNDARARLIKFSLLKTIDVVS